MGMLNTIANYGLPHDYIKDQESIIREMSLDEHKKLAQKYIKPDKMLYVVAGDKKTQMRNLGRLGFGRPVEVDKDGNVIK